MSDGMVVTDLNGKILRVNQYFCKLLGYKGEELIGKYGTKYYPKTNKNNIKKSFAKFKEELSEFENAYAEGKKEKIEEEIGDLFFTLINISRFLKINPDDALKKTARKFISRFHFIEKKIGKTGKSIEKFSLDELDKLWEKAKEKEISGEL